jgi:hypothetical protein
MHQPGNLGGHPTALGRLWAPLVNAACARSNRGTFIVEQSSTLLVLPRVFRTTQRTFAIQLGGYYGPSGASMSGAGVHGRLFARLNPTHNILYQLVAIKGAEILPDPTALGIRDLHALGKISRQFRVLPRAAEIFVSQKRLPTP